MDLSKILFGDVAILVTASIASVEYTPHPQEQALLSDTSDKRAREFLAGRFCAQQALRHFGIQHFPILRGAHREPLWPENLVGSISHCKDLAGAVVADKRQIKSVGLDIEKQKILMSGFERHVCTDSEKAWLGSLNGEIFNQALLLTFSIKEALFKCIYPVTGIHLGFRECAIDADLAHGEANLNILKAGLELVPNEISARFYINDEYIYSAVIWHHLPAVG